MMRKTILSIMVFTVITIGGLFSGVQAHALPVVGFQAGRIIDDAIFTAKDSMNAAQIQNFLNSKVPVCDTNGTQTSEYGGGTRAQWGASHGHPAPFTCLRDYSENGKSAAQIIYDKAQLYSINPQVLVVLLQKEQGLVTDTWPLDTQYRTATGYGCPDTAPCDSQYYGLTNQLDWAAKMFRAIMNASSTWYTPYILGNNFIRWSPSSSCGGSNVNILNRATQALYNYTPYQPNQSALNAGYGTGDSCGSYGNRNFYLYFNDWFGTSITGQYMSPLFKGVSSDTIYAIYGNTKYALTSFDVMNAYGLGKQPVTIVSDDLLSTYTEGPSISGTVAKKNDDPSGTIFLFDDGKRYPVSINDCRSNPDNTPVANSTWNIDCFNGASTHSLPNQLIDNFSVQDASLPNVILYNNSAWKIELGKKRRINDPIFVDILGGWGKVRWMKDINAAQPEGQLLIPSNSIVKFSGSDAIYLMTYTKLLPVNSMEDFYSWRLNKLRVYSLPSAYNAADPLSIGTPISSIAKDFANNYYLISSDGRRFPLPAGQTEWPTGSATTDADVYLNTLPSGGKTSIYRSTTGNIFVVENGKKRIIPTMGDFSGLGYTSGQLIYVTSSAESIVPYDSLKLAPNRLFKAAGNDTIRYVQGSNTSLQVNSTSHPGLPYSNLIIVDTATASKYPVSGNYIP